MITSQTDRIMQRPDRLEGLPRQARYVGSTYMDEEEARRLVRYFEGRITLWKLCVDTPTEVEKFTLRYLRRAYYYDALALFIEDFGATQLGRLFKQWDMQEQEEKKHGKAA